MLVLDFVIEEVHPSEQNNMELKKGPICSMQYGGHFVGLNHSYQSQAATRELLWELRRALCERLGAQMYGNVMPCKELDLQPGFRIPLELQSQPEDPSVDQPMS